MIKNIGHVAFSVSDMEKSLHFYCNQLDFTHLFQLKDGKGNPWINYLKITEHQFVELFYSKDLKSGDGVSYGHLCLEVDDIEVTVRELESRGVVLAQKITQGSDKNFQAWIIDPDGNRIELMQLHPDCPQLTATGFKG